MMLSTQSFGLSRLSNASGWRNFMAAGVAVGVHVLVLALLLTQWSSEKPDAPQVRTLTTQLITLPAPAPPAVPEIITPPEPVAAPPVQPVEPIEPVESVEAPKPDPRIQQQKLEQAALARKRVEEQERQRERELQQARQQREQQRVERQRLEAQAQQRDAEAQAARQAEAESAAAAIRQYLPIAKEAPDYPDRALDKNIEGDCTVSYRVNPQGRVENPQVIGDCHPLFVRPSLSAAKTFRYQPRLENGQAVAVDGVKNTFHYRIE
ncbi:energy transducer TonB [Pseudomonas sp. M30-35]|uniref:energy transducer TonB n=1 Tax=Pseudomonas sp. M30-35 TaxID=1981174 RepID=UPI000B3D1B1A|nr:energy transducer TonB [Pseudomonas sp. M30-35]ARU86639.1 energy transducer TonB [Pseudomonas sp. M30-35]